MKRARSRNVLFLSEMVLALTIFVLCAAVCMAVLWRAHTISDESAELNQAVFVAQNAAEAFQTTQEAEELAELLGGQVVADGAVYIYYSADWQPVPETEAAYCLTLSSQQAQGALLEAEFVVAPLAGEPIYQLGTTIYRPADLYQGGEG